MHTHMYLHTCMHKHSLSHSMHTHTRMCIHVCTHSHAHTLTLFNLLLFTFFHVGKAFIELVRYLFKLPDVKSFLSQRICQDPLENFFGCQRQRRGVHDNPNVHEFTKNTQALRVVNSFCKGPSRGNCRGGGNDGFADKENIHEPLPKRRRLRSNSQQWVSYSINHHCINPVIVIICSKIQYW